MTGETAQSIADLVRRARNPLAPAREQHEAFAVLVERFQAMALGTALRSCEDPDDARDACQIGFLAAWRLLPRLREPAAFGSWLKRLIRTQCARARQRRNASEQAAPYDLAEVADRDGDPAELVARHEILQWIRTAVNELPATEREAITLFYFLGESLRGVARILGMSVGRAGKCLYVGRLRLRRRLPRTIAKAFLAAKPDCAFSRRVQAGIFDEFAGEYRFARRPDRPIILRREGDVLACYAGGQRNVLASRWPDTLAPTEFDGEGRFRRDRRGRICDFIYYEFGRRMGVAQKHS